MECGEDFAGTGSIERLWSDFDSLEDLSLICIGVDGRDRCLQADLAVTDTEPVARCELSIADRISVQESPVGRIQVDNTPVILVKNQFDVKTTGGTIVETDICRRVTADDDPVCGSSIRRDFSGRATAVIVENVKTSSQGPPSRIQLR